jgi:hypothetical protein
MAQRMLLEELGQEKTSLLTHECVGMFADVIALMHAHACMLSNGVLLGRQ